MSSLGTMSRVSLFVTLLAAVCFASPARAQGADAPDESASTGVDQETKIVHVLMKTTKGDIVLALDAEKAPISVENFLMYADEGTYDGTVFHRVIDNFMIQGGGFEPSGEKRDSKDPIKNEWKNGLKNVRGTIAMARTNNPDSATNQFFINVNDNAFLDEGSSRTGGAGYAVFGHVVKGMEVVDDIKNVKTGSKPVPGSFQPMQNWPVEDVVIEKVRRLTAEEEAALNEGTTEEASSASEQG
ncbi:MAG: peptidylprolyl isomerase [Phycisphaerales bacterium]